jgi:uncharacterized membrane protein
VSTLLATSLYTWLLFLHILAASVWLGGLVTITLLATLVLRSRDVDLVKRLLDSMRFVGPIVLGLPMVALLGFGFWMVVNSDAWSFGQGWVIAGLSLFTSAFVFGVAFQARTGMAAQRALAAMNHDDAFRQFRRWSWGMRAIVVVLIVAVWDMVGKPGV